MGERGREKERGEREREVEGEREREREGEREGETWGGVRKGERGVTGGQHVMFHTVSLQPSVSVSAICFFFLWVCKTLLWKRRKCAGPASQPARQPGRHLR